MCFLYCGNCNATYDMGRVARLLQETLSINGHMLVPNAFTADVEVRLNGCPNSCLEQRNAEEQKRVVSVSSASVNLSAPDEAAITQWVVEEIHKLESTICTA